MTICIYKDKILTSDGRATTEDGMIVSDSFDKIGYIYQCSDTGARSVYADSFENSKIFAMYAFAGQVDHLKKFLRWAVTTLHPDVDAEIDESFDKGNITVDIDCVGLQALLVFKEYDLVRKYASNYEDHLYIDFTSNDFVAIGSGSKAAIVLEKYNPKLTGLEMVHYVNQTMSNCGGNVKTLNFEVNNQELFINNQPNLTLWKKFKKCFSTT